MRFPLIIILVSSLLPASSCQEQASATVLKTDTLVVARLKKKHQNFSPPISTANAAAYTNLVYDTVEVITAAPGTKSVLFNHEGTRLYAMNLEGMSVYEFDRERRTILREFKFKPTPGKGWDYEKDKSIPSFEEKPVEACLTHNDKLLWVSLHNAGGIVPIHLDSVGYKPSPKTKQVMKKVYVKYPAANLKDSFFVPLVKTGRTPKIISRTADNKHLLVSNWHSYNVTVMEVDDKVFPYARLVSTIPVASIPRGIAVDDQAGRSYVAIMGGATVTVINNTVWMKESDIAVASNPRHIVLDSNGRLFISYNRIAKIACVDGKTGKTLFTTDTNAQPRTIILSKNQEFLFVTCYSSDFVDVFRIREEGFEKVISLPCKGHPVGVDIVENDTKLEAWVCSYTNGAINIFSFFKK